MYNVLSRSVVLVFYAQTTHKHHSQDNRMTNEIPGNVNCIHFHPFSFKKSNTMREKGKMEEVSHNSAGAAAGLTGPAFMLHR